MLCVAQDEGVEAAALSSMHPRLTLLRWCNHHLINAGAETVASVASLAAAPVLVATLLRQVAVEEEALSEEEAAEEAERMVAAENGVQEALEKELARCKSDLGVPDVFRAGDVLSRSDKVVIALLALVFDPAPGLRCAPLPLRQPWHAPLTPACVRVGKDDMVEMEELDEPEGDRRGVRMFQSAIACTPRALLRRPSPDPTRTLPASQCGSTRCSSRTWWCTTWWSRCGTACRCSRS